MNIIHAIILGIIEGLTEFLPVSSTAHLILIGRLMGLADTDFLKTFEIIIQFGAILAVLVYYAKRFLVDWDTNKKIIVAFIPTAIIGFALYKVIKQVFFGDYTLILWALILGGIGLIIFEKMHDEERASVHEITAISYKQAFIIGCAQAIAVIPGVSRSGATIVAGMLLGIRRRVIVEFSFLLAVPTMIAASGYDLLKSHAGITSSGYGLIAAGFIAAFVAAYASIKFFLDYIKQHSFTAFGIYRIAFAGLMILLFAFL